MKKPVVSVLMTVYNHEKYVKDSIKSILNQSLKNFELIVINNGSTDRSKNIIINLKDKRIKFYNLKKNIGRTNGLNFGLKKCKGQFIAIQDSDDISKKNRILTQVNFLKKNNKIALIGSNYNIIDQKGNIINKTNININLQKETNEILFNNLIGHSTVMYRKDILNFVKGYPRDYTYAQDYAFYLKIIKKFKIEIISNNLVNLRLNHINSESFRLKKTMVIQKEEIKLIFWILKNINTNFFEKIKIFKKLIFLSLKIIFLLFR